MPARNITLGSKLRTRERKIRKIVVKDGKVAVALDPNNPKNRFYTKVEKDSSNRPSRITHIAFEARTILKENPELLSFLEVELKKKNQIKTKLETLNGTFILEEKQPYDGYSYNKTFVLAHKNKKTGRTKKYFIKEYPKHQEQSTSSSAQSEFLAVMEMHRLGFNIIKPEFAITDLKNGLPNIIVYDFTNMKTYKDAVISGKITGSEILESEKLFENICRSKKLLKDLTDFSFKSYDRHTPKNVFVKRLPNGKLRFYFSDIYWENEAYKRKMEEYLWIKY